MAGPDDLPDLARLRWLDAEPEERADQSVEDFTTALAQWWAANEGSHRAFVAVQDNELVGMAWLAVVERVPRPGASSRRSGDIQSVFVLAENRGHGIGTELVRTASDQALKLGADRVTVHSSRSAVPVYERLGFHSSRELLHRPAP